MVPGQNERIQSSPELYIESLNVQFLTTHPNMRFSQLTHNPVTPSLYLTSFFVLLSRYIAVAAPTPSPTITTSSGTYAGSVNQQADVETFLGLRYGQPPVGSLRFKAPVAVSTPPTGVQDATNFGNACAQQVSVLAC